MTSNKLSIHSFSSFLACRFSIFFLMGLFLVGVLSTLSSHAEEVLKWDDSRLAEVLPEPIHGETVLEGDKMRLILDRSFARPQDRWLDIRVDLKALDKPLKDYELVAEIQDIHDPKKKAVITNHPALEKNILRADLRSLASDRASVRVKVLENGKEVDMLETQIAAQETSQPLHAGEKVAVRIDFPKEGEGFQGTWPVTFGVPFAEGQLWDASILSLEDQDGKAVAFQREVTGHWIPDGSIQWVRFDAEVGRGTQLFVKVNDKPQALSKSGVRVTQTKDGKNNTWIVDTGVAQYEIGGGNSPLRSIVVDGQRVAETKGARGLYVMDQNGQIATAGGSPDIRVEASGPQAASVRIEGDYLTDEGKPLAHYIVRVEAFAGEPFAQITHTLVLNQDTNKVWFKEMGWEWKVADAEKGKAIFALKQPQTVELESADTDTFLFQQSVKGWGGRENLFRLATVEGGKEDVLKTGDFMGDWFALRNPEGRGLMMTVRDAALQAPKEFFVGGGKMNLLFFSSRAGEELDFRSATLVKKWGLKPLGDFMRKRTTQKDIDTIAAYPSNAIGWSKTHHVLFAPIASKTETETLASWAGLNSEQVFALVDPQWLYRSNVMGPLHPKDDQQFPEAEALLAGTMQRYIDQVPGQKYTGFVDYYAGPHYTMPTRYRLTYTLLRDAWLQYVRSGDRRYRQFAEGSNHAFRDNYVAHWDGERKSKGLFISGGLDMQKDLPFYWERDGRFEMTTSANINQFIWDYQLTGDRRSKDVVEEMAEGFSKHWDPKQKDWRIFMVLRTLRQLYEFTGDRKFLVSMEESANYGAYDPEGELLLTKDRPYGSSTYKTNTDMGIMIENAQALGSRRWEAMAEKTTHYWFARILGESPLQRVSGAYLNDLYAKSSAPHIAQMIDYYLRYASTAYDPETKTTRGFAYSTMDIILQGIPYFMDVVEKTGVRQSPLASFVQYDDYGSESAIYLQKDDQKNVVLWVRAPANQDDPSILDGLVQVKALGQKSKMSQDTISWDQNNTTLSIRFPKDAVGGTYQIKPRFSGNQFALADQNTGLVFACAGYWRPNTFQPAYKYYFQVPEQADAPQIFFEYGAKLFLPDGSSFNEGKIVNGWIALPKEHPGLWAFQPIKNGLVSSRGIPPYFAVNNPKAWFDPAGVEKKTEATPNSAELVDTSSVKGISLPLEIKGEEKHPLPYGQGTIEFFFKPHWGAFDLSKGEQSVIKPLFRVMNDKRPWEFVYRVDPKGASVNLGPKEPSHSFFFSNCYMVEPDNANSTIELRAWNTRKILEKDQWVHVALVWGRHEIQGSHTSVIVPYAKIFINGQGAGYSLQQANTHKVPEGTPKSIVFPKDADGEIAYLRVSDTPRYQKDFKAPTVDTGLTQDAQTIRLDAIPKKGKEEPQINTDGHR